MEKLHNPAAYTKDMLKVSEVAACLGVTNQTIRNWVKDGTIKATNPGNGRMFLIPKREAVRIFNGE